MKKGQSGRIKEIEEKDLKRKIHLLEMGMTKGTKIKVKKISPYGGTISIELRGYELCIDRNQANKVIIDDN